MNNHQRGFRKCFFRRPATPASTGAVIPAAATAPQMQCDRHTQGLIRLDA